MRSISPVRRSRGPALAALALAAGLTAGCGGSSAGSAAAPAGSAAPAAPTSSVPSPAAVSAPPGASAPGPAADGGECGSARDEIRAGTTATGLVTDVEVASCARATVTTSLGTTPADVQSARAVCAIAGNEASTHGVAAVSVLSSDGTELVTGTGPDDCKPVS